MFTRIPATALAATLAVMLATAATQADEVVPGESGYTSYVSSGSYPSHRPSLSTAVARRAEARIERLHAELALAYEFRKMRFQFERSPEYLATAHAERAAFADYQEVRASALARLAGDPMYATLVRRRDEITDRIIAAHAGGETDSANLMALAKEKLGYASAITEMETRFLASDRAFLLAREHFQMVGGDLAFLRSEFDASSRYHPDVEGLRGRLNAARVDSVSAAAYARALTSERRAERRYLHAIPRSNGRPNYRWSGDHYGHGHDHDHHASCRFRDR